MGVNSIEANANTIAPRAADVADYKNKIALETELLKLRKVIIDVA